MIARLRRWFRRSPSRFDAAWEPVLRRGFEHWNLLDAAEIGRMRYLVARFFETTRWEAAKGMDLTDEVKVLISAQASMLLLGLDLDEYPQLTSVIVHRSTVRLRGARPSGSGTWSSGTQYLAGQAHHKGPVILSWSAARRGALRPDHGHNVVYHEFAHRLDMLDGLTDGTPPLGDPEAVTRWVEVCSTAFARAQQGESVLGTYAATNPAEFFAVATEVFFNRPVELDSHEPDLYAALAAFYGQDPVARQRRHDALVASGRF